MSIDFQRDRHREDRQPVRVVRRAVQWIDDPAAPRAAGRGATLLRENRIVRERRGEPADDQLLGALVHFRHEVGRLALEGDAMRRAKLRSQDLAGGARRVDCHAAFERRRHQSRRSLGTSSAVATPTAMSARPFTPSAALTPNSDASAPTWN